MTKTTRRILLVLPFAALLPACMATTEETRNRAPVPVVQPSDAYIELSAAKDGGATGYLVLTYADKTQRNFRPSVVPNGVSLEPQGVRALWCGVRPDCGIREERLAVSMTREAVAASARDGLVLVLETSEDAHNRMPFMSNPGGPRQERIILPAYQMRHALRRGNVRF